MKQDNMPYLDPSALLLVKCGKITIRIIGNMHIKYFEHNKSFEVLFGVLKVTEIQGQINSLANTCNV